MANENAQISERFLTYIYYPYFTETSVSLSESFHQSTSSNEVAPLSRKLNNVFSHRYIFLLLVHKYHYLARFDNFQHYHLDEKSP